MIFIFQLRIRPLRVGIPNDEAIQLLDALPNGFAVVFPVVTSQLQQVEDALFWVNTAVSADLAVHAKFDFGSNRAFTHPFFHFESRVERNRS